MHTFTDVSGLVVTVSILGDGVEVDTDTNHLSTLKVGEELQLTMHCWTHSYDDLLGKEISYVATLKQGEIVLDTHKFP